jgi:hypothetical protein
VQPGSLVDANGDPVQNAQVGISPVPASLVMDMLPEGLLQHTFDITIQAPGGATFTTPAQLTLPNVFGAAPGTQLDILSFDHTTGRLVIDGTGTVSADGQTVTSDPGSGVTAPGWHGVTPPGTQNNPPCMLPSVFQNVTPDPVMAGVQDYFFTGDIKTDGSGVPLANAQTGKLIPNQFTLSFANAAQKLVAGQSDCSPVNASATPLIVTITTDGNQNTFLQGLPTQQTLVLFPQQQQNIVVNVKQLLTSSILSKAKADVLYGTKVHIQAYQQGLPDNTFGRQNYLHLSLSRRNRRQPHRWTRRFYKDNR